MAAASSQSITFRVVFRVVYRAMDRINRADVIDNDMQMFLEAEGPDTFPNFTGSLGSAANRKIADRARTATIMVSGEP
jgi:hypothetical protein